MDIGDQNTENAEIYVDGDESQASLSQFATRDDYDNKCCIFGIKSASIHCRTHKSQCLAV
jgi:hypothetical protein